MAAKKIEEFMIVNRRTGKALQAAGMENGQNVVQAAPDGGDSQLWTQVGGKFINKASGKALDVVHGGVESGTWAHLWDSVDDAPSQVWEAVKVTATYKKLLNAQSGKVLDIVDMSEDDGAPAQIWDDVDGVGQQWKFVTAEANAPSKTVTRTAKKPAAPAAEPAPAPAAKKQRVAEAVKETVEAVKEEASAVLETVTKSAATKKPRAQQKAAEAVEETAAVVEEAPVVKVAAPETVAKPATAPRRGRGRKRK